MPITFFPGLLSKACSCLNVSFVPPSSLKGPDRIVSVPAVLAGLPSLHRDAAGEASASVSAGASQPRSGPAARPGPGAVGAVRGPVHGEKLLHQQRYQGEVVEAPSTCPRTQCQQGSTAITQQLKKNSLRTFIGFLDLEDKDDLYCWKCILIPEVLSAIALHVFIHHWELLLFPFSPDSVFIRIKKVTLIVLNCLLNIVCQRLITAR